MDFVPIRTRRTFEEAVAQIAEQIAAGALRPGDQLPAERRVRDERVRPPRCPGAGRRPRGRVEAAMDLHLAQLEGTWERESGRALVREVPDFLRGAGGRGANS